MRKKWLSPPATKLPSEYVKEGWHQGDLAVDNRKRAISSEEKTAVGVCLMGAIYRWAPFKPTKYRKREKFISKLRSLLPTHRGKYPRPTHWNDAPCRTQKQVVRFLRKVERALGLTKPSSH